MKPTAGSDYLATAAHIAAGISADTTNVGVRTPGKPTKSMRALVYFIDPKKEEMKIAYPAGLFDHKITDA
eukprot:11194200-Lingulodinium_polyedra.AAC.1